MYLAKNSYIDTDKSQFKVFSPVYKVKIVQCKIIYVLDSRKNLVKIPIYNYKYLGGL